MRHLILVLFLLIPSLSWAQADQDNGLLWVALNLFDTADPSYSILHGAQPTDCSNATELAVPYGFAQATDYSACIEPIRIRVSGWINGQLVTKRMLWWQPGAHGDAMIGIPRNQTTSIKIVLPDLVRAGGYLYKSSETVLLRPGGNEKMMIVDVPMSRLARVTLVDLPEGVLADALFRYRVEQTDGTYVHLIDDTASLRAPRGYLLDVTAHDRHGEVFPLTSPAWPQANLDFAVFCSWEYQVRFIPKQTRRTLVAKR